MHLGELAEKAYSNAKSKGFHDGPFNIAEKIALIHSELSEALEATRKDVNLDLLDATKRHIHDQISAGDFTGTFKTYKESFGFEIADALIRIGDLAGSIGLDLEWYVKVKMAYNATRPAKHGKLY